MPASGKSTLGKLLAESLGLLFIDLDQKIESSTGRSIGEFFEAEGEDVFRVKEKEQLGQVIQSNPSFLMATGGGTPCFYDNMALMKSVGLVVFLNPSIRIIYERLIGNQGIKSRPLLSSIQNDSMLKELNIKFSERIQYYSKAHVTIKDEKVTLTKIKQVVVNYS